MDTLSQDETPYLTGYNPVDVEYHPIPDSVQERTGQAFTKPGREGQDEDKQRRGSKRAGPSNMPQETAHKRSELFQRLRDFVFHRMPPSSSFVDSPNHP
jgi:hypothetical protein